MPHPEPSRLAMETLHGVYQETGQDVTLAPIVLLYAACMAFRIIEKGRPDLEAQLDGLFLAAEAHLRETTGEAVQ